MPRNGITKMTIEITKLSKAQWGKVGKVILWLAVASACAALTAYIAKNPVWLATLPGWNVLGVFIQGLLTNEQTNALNAVPADVKAEAEQVVPAITPPTTPVA